MRKLTRDERVTAYRVMAQEYAAGRSRAHVVEQGVKSGLSERVATLVYKLFLRGRSRTDVRDWSRGRWMRAKRRHRR